MENIRYFAPYAHKKVNYWTEPIYVFISISSIFALNSCDEYGRKLAGVPFANGEGSNYTNEIVCKRELTHTSIYIECMSAIIFNNIKASI